MENERSRLWLVLLYPEDPTHVNALEYIDRNLDYVGICHDRDVDDDGNLKKAHFHVILKFPQARYRNAIVKELGIAPNYMEKMASWNKSARYLLHFGWDEKFQYSETDLIGPLAPTVLKLTHQNKDEDSRMLDLLALFDDVPFFLSFTDAIHLACQNGLYSEFRRAGYSMKFILDEHNAKRLDGAQKL